MRFKDITSELTWKNVAIGALAVGFLTATFPPVYLKIEEYIGQKMFCSDYGHLKGEPREVINQHAAAYWPDIHPSNEEKYFNAFAGWVDKCE